VLTVLVSLHVKPERVKEFVAAIRENAAASVRDEPGCLRFDVHCDTQDPAHFVLHELYADEAAFYEAHRSAPHYFAFRARLPELLVEGGGHVNTYCTPIALTEDFA
jgi:autoinducer 2-degrading protein